MPLESITDPSAIRKAVEEFDRVGRDNFLRKYGFGSARGWMLVHEGREYDAKAILGVAHRYQHPELGHLSSDQFHGGLATAKRLRAMGFTVAEPDHVPQQSTADQNQPSSRYWVFVCNPRRWAIDAFLRSGRIDDTWGIRPSDAQNFAPGQLALVRVGIDQRSKAELRGGPRLQPGIYAVCQVLSRGEPGTGANDEFWANGQERTSEWPTVRVRYLKNLLANPLSIERLKQQQPGISPLLLNGFQGSSFPISESDFEAVLEEIGLELGALPLAVETDGPDGDTPASAQDELRRAAPVARNPVWGRDELILGLDLYMRHRPTPPDDRHSDVIELSALLTRMGAQIRAMGATSFRNPNGVAMKLQNFRHLDPEQHGKGLSGGGKGERDVWAVFAYDPERLKAAAAAIRSAVDTGPDLSEPIPDGFEEAEEGQLLTRLHRFRERRLAERRKAKALRQHGRLQCEACEFDFSARYGERGRGFIECHHVRPVSELTAGEKTRLEDLTLLCANCHRMIHVRRPWLSIDELRQIMIL